jgi:hypothetical protein
MGFTQSDSIEVKQIKGKGRGVFARRLIYDGEVIERVPVLVLPVGESRTAVGPTPMSDYCFDWGRGQGQRTLKRSSGKDFQKEVLVPTTSSAFHDEARPVGMLLQK